MKQLSVVILFLFSTPLIFAQEVEFKTKVSKNRLGVNERLRVTFSVNQQGVDNFKPPAFKDFKAGGLMQSTNFSSSGGKMVFEQSYTYTLQPVRQGVLTIGRAEATYNGKTIKTEPLKVVVTKAVELPKDPNDPRYIASQNIHLVAEVSNSSPYVGESIAVVYKLYVDVNSVSVRNTREVESPSFNGFWNQNIEVNGLGAKDGTYQGKQVRYVIVKKAVLIPQKAGKLTIDPMEMEISAGVPIGRRDLFGNVITRNTTYTVSAGRRNITVKALPEEGKPVDFSGAVGDFSFKVTSSKENLKANESAQIKVEVSGKGNLKLIDLPAIETPNGLERYEPEHKESIRTNLSGLSGKVYDQYTVVPQFRGGKYKIPPISFSYFSLKDKTYKTVTNEAIVINAAEGKAPVAETPTTRKRDVIATGSSIRYISSNTNLTSMKAGKDFLGSDLFYALLALPVLAIPIGIFIGKKKRERDSDIIGNKRRKADRLARKYLSEARKQLGNKEEFYIALEKALHNYLKAKLQVETSDISKEKIALILRNKSVDESTINNFIKVLDDCDYARYTPTTNVMMQQEYEKAKTVIAKIDKQL